MIALKKPEFKKNIQSFFSFLKRKTDQQRKKDVHTQVIHVWFKICIDTFIGQKFD